MISKNAENDPVLDFSGDVSHRRIDGETPRRRPGRKLEMMMSNKSNME
jgi:hypothetical protein